MSQSCELSTAWKKEIFMAASGGTRRTAYYSFEKDLRVQDNYEGFHASINLQIYRRRFAEYRILRPYIALKPDHK
jgi:hypothetical protein